MLTRRRFASTLAASISSAPIASSAGSPVAPNILWISCEDIGPHLGCYGDTYATSPHLDAFAARSQRYSYAWSNAPVCAPARTTVISGLYAPSTGSQHMRSRTHLPAGIKMFPQYLREAGYYASNNAKEDYNLEKPGQVWDDSSKQAHWRNRGDRPFFSVFNLEITHESKIRTRPHTWKHDPAKVRVPAYHPDTREVREDWAQYYDNITTMDGQAGRLLAELEKDGLADSTIVFFWGDHGSGMPRSKRVPCNSGLQVPLLVHVPEKWRALAGDAYKPGSASDRLVSFVDFAPTMLSLAGVKAPAQFQGSAFLGPQTSRAPEYLHGFRGRMDERYDMARSIRDRKFVYVRNYMPQRIPGAHIDYMFETPTTRVWKKLYDEGTLAPPRTYFWENKPVEELYDLENDPDEVHNLAPLEEHRETLDRMFTEQQRHAAEIRDLGYLPESEIHRRAAGAAPYDLGHDNVKYPLSEIMAAAEQAASRCSW
ncbi:MAG: sulfatase, partial [Bryobacteraceae bacterium]